jgi:hypothetical protein
MRVKGKTEFSHLRERAPQPEPTGNDAATEAKRQFGDIYHGDFPMPRPDHVAAPPPGALEELQQRDDETPTGPPEDGRLVILIAEDGTEAPARFKKTRRFAHGKWWPWDKWIDQTSGQEVPFQYARWREWPY